MKMSVLLIAASALAVAACNRDDSSHDAVTDNTAVTGDTAADNGALAAAPTTAQGFVDAAAASDKFEIESSRLAQAAGASQKVKDFAAMMIKGHTDSTAKLKATIAGLQPPLTPNDALNPEQQAALDGLNGKTGADFDSAYAAAQVTAHQNTLDALKAYADGGDNPALVDFAKQMIPVVTDHLEQAKALPK